jgi:hypothetical protein
MELKKIEANLLREKDDLSSKLNDKEIRIKNLQAQIEECQKKLQD